MALLWPDRDGAAAANNLHQALYVARRALGGASGGLFVLRDDVVLLSDGAAPWLDTDAFEAACLRARQTRDPQDYRAAAALYRGDLLPEDRFEDWAEGPRERLRESHLGLLVEYAEVLSGRGEHAQVVEVAGAVVAADPVHEGAHRTLMAALAASGRRYEALASFDRLREALAEEYAADPEPATRRLYRRLLTSGDPLPEAPRGAAPVPARDAPRPEQTSFVGRRRELAEVEQALRRTRLLTLTGPGGAGKTRLAYEVAARLADGVHLAELASLSRPELVPQAVATVLDVPLPERGTAEVALARQLGERRLLLVLDNCEHLLDACARLAAALLRTCPDLVVLATSREPLRVGGEVTRRTPSLALPDLRRLPPPARLAELESVRLFVERARDVAPGFVLDETTAPAVAEICVRLDGTPLAIELAAARTSALAPAQIAARLDDAVRVLGRGSRAAVTRQQTLHATLAWSHDLLDQDERALFGAWRCSQAACRWRRWSRSAAAAWTSSTCSAAWSTSPWCRPSTPGGRRGTACWRPSGSSPTSGCGAPVHELHLYQGGGAMGRVPADATAYAHRGAAYVLEVIARSPERAGFDRHADWARTTREAMQPWGGGAYVNFTTDPGEDRVRASYPPDTYARLVMVKDRYDPTNLFRLNQNIQPSRR